MNKWQYEIDMKDMGRYEGYGYLVFLPFDSDVAATVNYNTHC